MKSPFVLLVASAMSLVALAKLPAPSDEAKAKSAEAAAKTVHAGKVDGYLLCKSQDKAAVSYYKSSKSSGKETHPAVSVPACVDPGPFVYKAATPVAVASTPAGVAVAPAAVPPGAGKHSKKP